MEHAEKVRRIVSLLLEKAESDDKGTPWAYATADAPDLYNIVGSSNTFETSFSSTNNVIVGPRAVAILKYGVVVFTYVGDEVSNLYWTVKNNVEGSSHLDTVETDLQNLP